MSKLTLTVLTALSLTACATQEQIIAHNQDRCTKIGYAPNTPEHTACVERGTTQAQQSQSAATGAAADVIITYAILEALL